MAMKSLLVSDATFHIKMTPESSCFASNEISSISSVVWLVAVIVVDPFVAVPPKTRLALPEVGVVKLNCVLAVPSMEAVAGIGPLAQPVQVGVISQLLPGAPVSE
ncbi:hypothetical protein [Haliscomenobacter sp.]|uniref:hypothetical protein n=1 Tax=Haliscomenobacter sp. TaxID=2717303 RepID=UPI003BAD7400